ncbi:MAG TPA: response regulator transcription factor [Acidobacteriota bacterium]|nr:response regulator transcription factor [Acidobacteriota bacterium]
MKRILLVEDNRNLAYGLQNNLEIEGYEVEVARNGPQGLQAARTSPPDLIILDLMLPGLDGFRLLRSLREGGSDVPVLILSARGEELDKVRGFRFGADDYVTKPFSVLELLARIEALLRRSGGQTSREENQRPVSFGKIEVDPATREVKRDGELVALAPKEFDLLWELLQRDGAVTSRLELIQRVWGYPDTVLTRTVDTHIGELRRKLEEDPSNPRHILTVRKAGYRLSR